MSDHPYKKLPEIQFWSSGVKDPVSERGFLAISPLLDSIAKEDPIVSGGSCFAQYIGKELVSRGYNYLLSSLSGDRTESFGVGNIYTLAQFKQWLEFSLGLRLWGNDCIYEDNDQWFDLLLPNRSALSSKSEILEQRIAIKNEMLSYLENARLLIFTIGLTETWRSLDGDIFPACPGTLSGEFEESKHIFHNFTFDEIQSDLVAIEAILAKINPQLNIVYTVSPVPLTATNSGKHVLAATYYSKSVIRAAVGQYCDLSQRATYFPSYELINHPVNTDQRFDENLRSISEKGVAYVMGHAFGEKPDHTLSANSVNNQVTCSPDQDAVCEEALLDGYAKLANSVSGNSDIVLAGDCHLERLAAGFETIGVDVIGGIVMHGSSFTDYKYRLCPDRIFLPHDNPEALEIWLNIHEKMKSFNGNCNIITNIGFQTHRTITLMTDALGTPILTEKDIDDYYSVNYALQIHMLYELTKYGQVWLLEDPNFYIFFEDHMERFTVNKNFAQYTHHMRKIAKSAGINYLNPCDEALQTLMANSVSVAEIIHPQAFLGNQVYYDCCAAIIARTMGVDTGTVSRAA